MVEVVVKIVWRLYFFRNAFWPGCVGYSSTQFIWMDDISGLRFQHSMSVYAHIYRYIYVEQNIWTSI